MKPTLTWWWVLSNQDSSSSASTRRARRSDAATFDQNEQNFYMLMPPPPPPPPPHTSSCSQMFFEIAVLKNSAIFTRIHLCWSLILCFPVNIAKQNFFIEYCWWLLLYSVSVLNYFLNYLFTCIICFTIWIRLYIRYVCVSKYMFKLNNWATREFLSNSLN